jgi:hypothetical protein
VAVAVAAGIGEAVGASVGEAVDAGVSEAVAADVGEAVAAAVGEALGASVGEAEAFDPGVGLRAGVGVLGAAIARAGTLRAARPSNPQVESRRNKSRLRNIEGSGV